MANFASNIFAMKKIFLLIRLARDNNMFDSFATTLYRPEK